MTKRSTKGLLKEILSDHIEWVYVHISNKAVEWAVAGFIDEANNPLEQLFGNSKFLTQNTCGYQTKGYKPGGWSRYEK